MFTILKSYSYAQSNMDKSEAYAFLFTDTVFSNLVITAHSELALFVMQMLGFYSSKLILIYAFLGALCAFAGNYLFGIVLYNLYRFSSDLDIQARYGKLTKFFAKYGWLILFLAFVPNVGKFIPMLAGFTRYRIINTMIYSGLSKALYYIWLLYY